MENKQHQKQNLQNERILRMNAKTNSENSVNPDNSASDNLQPFYNTAIPSDWEVKTLNELGTFSKGKGILKEQVISEGLPCIRYGEIYTTHDFIIKKFRSFISEEVACESKEIREGDILFAGSGETAEEIGKAVAYIGNEKAFAGGDVIILSTIKEVNAECLSYALETDFAKKQKRILGQGNSIVHIYPSDLAKVKIPIPPLPEQKAIANVLNLMDTAIDKNNQLIVKKELQKKWLMQNLLTGKKRLKQNLQNSGINRINNESNSENHENSDNSDSDNWKEVKLGDVFEFIKSYPISRDGLTKSNRENLIYCVHYGDIHAFYESDFLDFSNQQCIPQIIDKAQAINEKDYLKEGDVIIADASEDYEGVGEAIVVINIENKIAVSGLHTIVLRDFTGKTSANFRAYLFASEKVRNELRKKATGTSVYSVTKTTLESLMLNLPSPAEQIAIAQVLQAADKEIQLLKTKTEKLREQKKGMMQVLLSGKKRLKV